ncbi:transmembrane protein 42-like isoform X2 [Mobula hypostoma]|uniref:transmembrane protein 42-like isoform X2 n=1 Tax=Mobula hypostoma TaxID=723540 RepID=UPI002FC29458
MAGARGPGAAVTGARGPGAAVTGARGPGAAVTGARGPGAAMAVGAGALGAVAGAAAKLALGGERLLLRAGCGGLVLFCNALMWMFFAKALRYSTSAQASLTSVASNFLSSAFLGKLLFGEVHKLLWWVGITMTLCGLLLLHTVKDMDQSNTYKKEE